MDIQWFPGHMAKTRRLLQQSIRLVDVVVELVDARIPNSSRNPILNEITGLKPHVIVLSKADLADPAMTEKWLGYFSLSNFTALAVDAAGGAGVNRIVPVIKRLGGEKKWPGGAAGRPARPVRCMVAGIPNVGKSSLINRLVGRKAARAADTPGVTRGQQWVRIGGAVDLLDTPGVLWPKLDDPDAAYRLAVTGAIKDQVYNLEEVAASLAGWLRENHRERLEDRYGIKGDLDSRGVLDAIGEARGLFLPGRKVDIYKSSVLLMKEFRGGLLGRFTLDDIPLSH